MILMVQLLHNYHKRRSTPRKVRKLSLANVVLQFYAVGDVEASLALIFYTGLT